MSGGRLRPFESKPTHRQMDETDLRLQIRQCAPDRFLDLRGAQIAHMTAATKDRDLLGSEGISEPVQIFPRQQEIILIRNDPHLGVTL